MAMDIVNVKNDELNGLLSKIQIGGKVYEIKDLIARENIETLADLLDALSGKVGNVAEGQNLADIIKNIQENAYDDTELRGLITALQEADKLLANKEQVATDIAAAVAAEAEIARAAEKANTDEIARVDAALKLAVENDAEGIDSIKELATWVNTHGAAAENMSKAITKNAEDIAANTKAIEDEAKARDDADKAIDERLDAIEAELGDGEGSVTEQINAALEAAKKYADDEDANVEAEVAKKEDKANLKALAYKASATGTVAGETISGVKATGTSTGSITVELEQSEHAMNSTGKFTPAGAVAGSVTVAEHQVPVALSHESTAVTLEKGDYTPAGNVSVTLSGANFNAITGVGTQASFVEGEFTPAELKTKDVTIAAHNHLEAAIDEADDECLVFTASMIEALTFQAVDTFSGGSKAADTFTPNSLPTMAAQAVGVADASFAGTKAEKILVTTASYEKATSGSGTCAGGTYDINASFTGSEGDVNVAGKCHDYAVKTAEFNGAAIELNVGDIAVGSKTVTVE